MVERNKAIKACLEDGPKSFTGIKRETSFSAGRTDRGLKDLLKRNEILHDERWYALPKDSDKLQKKVEDFCKGEVKDKLLLYEVRKDHTKKLRRVLVRWRDELASFPSRIQSSPKWEFPNAVVHQGLHFEDTYDFKHLTEHFPQLMERWTRYQEKLGQQVEIGWIWVSKLGENIADDLGMDLHYTHHPTNEPGVYINFPELILQALQDLAMDGIKWKKGVGKMSYEQLCDKAAKIIPHRNGYWYTVSTATLSPCQAIFLPKHKEVEEKRKKLDEYKRELMEELRNSVYIDKVKKHYELGEELWEERTKIRLEVEKYSSYVVVPRICEIIRKAIL